jgi:heme-degrading monooxygenase HmoA
VSGFHIAQVNIALAKAPVDSPLLADFAALLDPVNALADESPGFVWRLQTEEGNATAIRAFDDDRLIVNMSVWESIDDLTNFVYRSPHVEVMRRRREWFERIEVFMTLWWVEAGHIPTVGEAEQRLDHLRAHGPTPFAFTFKARYAAPGGTGAALIDDELGCPA